MAHDPVRLLVLGKTGVGKSSFINYFVGCDVAQVGDGFPVTMTMKQYSFNIDGHPFMLVDSKGIEALGSKEQVEQLKYEICKRNNCDMFSMWYHTIFYCVSMANTKLETFEIDFINSLSKDISQHIHIILTKCDTCSPSDIENMKQYINQKIENNERIRIYEIVSIDKIKRNGKRAFKSGKEELVKGVFELFWDDVSKKIAKEYSDSFDSSVRSLLNFSFSSIDIFIDKKVKFKTLKEFIKDEDACEKVFNEELEKLEVKFDKLLETENKAYRKKITPLLEFAAGYKSSITGNTEIYSDLDFDCVLSDFIPDDTINDMINDEVIAKLFKRTGKYLLESEDDDEMWDDDHVLKSIVKNGKLIKDGILDLFSLKRNLKKYINECKTQLEENLPDKNAVANHVYNKTMTLLQCLK